MKILAFSDINWSQYRQLTSIVKSESPDVVLLAGDITGDGIAHGQNRLQQLLNLVERNRIKTFAVKGNWDDSAYDDMFRHRQHKFVEEISGRYVNHQGYTFLGVPYSYFESLKDLRRIRKRFPQTPDIVVAHPPTKRRIWLFELLPKIVVVGHDDLRVCNVGGILLVCTNLSPASYAILKMTKNRMQISYRQKDPIGRYRPSPITQLTIPSLQKVHTLKYDSVWDSHSQVLKWKTGEHHCYKPPFAYPAKDSEYGRMLLALLVAKRTMQKSELVGELPKLSSLNAPKSLVSEFLEI